MSAATKTRAWPTCGWYFGVMPQTYIRTGRPETSKTSFCPLRVDVMRCVTVVVSHQQVPELYRLARIATVTANGAWCAGPRTLKTSKP